MVGQATVGREGCSATEDKTAVLHPAAVIRDFCGVLSAGY